nr:ATP-binding cassette domain-containing protein [uncultured Methanoregula sp.]
MMETQQPYRSETPVAKIGPETGKESEPIYGNPDGSGREEDNIIRIEHLTKIFQGKMKTVTAVSDVTFNVKRGEIFGLLGPNGAGKSTLIRILTTILSPTSGSAYLNNYDITRFPENVRSIIGVCPQNSTLDVELTAYDNLDFYGRLVNVPDAILDKRIWELLEMTELTDRAHVRVGTFSGGMRRKLEIVRAFIHHPLILFLDEPTIGLDPEARREVWQQISDLNSERTTIILTTHYMDEAEKLCNRIAFMDKGRLVALDTLENLKLHLPAGDLIEIGVERIDDLLIPAILANPLINTAEIQGNRIVISARNGSKVLPALITIFENNEIPMTSISIHSPSLEDIFLYVTGSKLEDGNTSDQKPAAGGKTR